MRTKICLLSLLIFGTAYTQSAVRRVVGRIRAVGGEPLGGDVTVVQSGSATVLTTHTADGEGAFAFDVPLGRVLLVAKADDHVSAERELVSGSPGITHLEFVLPRAGTVSGRVIDEAGGGVSNASITLSYRGERRSFTFGDEGGDIVTDAFGYFTLPLVAEGKPFVIHAASADRLPSSSGTLILREDRITGVVIPLVHKGQMVRGLVVDALGLPVAGAAARMRLVPDVRDFDAEERDSLAFLRATNRAEVTDRNGAFQFRGVPPGRLIVVVEGRAGQAASEEATLAPGRDLTIRIVLRPQIETPDPRHPRMERLRAPQDLQWERQIVSGALAIPGLGPFIAAGPIMGALAGMGAGGAVGGLVGALVGMGIPEYEAKRYEGRVKKGGVLLSVHCDKSEWVNKAKSILRDTGAEDVSSAGEAGADFAKTDKPLPRGAERRQESVGTQATDWEKPRDREVQRRAAGSGQSYGDYDSDYRTDFESRYMARGYAYEEYEPAYRFGSTWTSDDRYRDRDWPAVESEARRDW